MPYALCCQSTAGSPWQQGLRSTAPVQADLQFDTTGIGEVCSVAAVAVEMYISYEVSPGSLQPCLQIPIRRSFHKFSRQGGLFSAVLMKLQARALQDALSIATSLYQCMTLTCELYQAVSVHVLKEGLALQLDGVSHSMHRPCACRICHKGQSITRCQQLLQLCQLQP